MTKKDTKNQDEELDVEEETRPSHKASTDAEALADKSAGEAEENDGVEELRQKLEQFDNNYKRALADYQNLQKRVSDERRDLIFSANKDLLLRILSVLDTLILANQHDASEGLKVAIKQFEDVLKSEGVTKIETQGAEFNPHLMEAVAVVEGDPSTGSGQGENKVLEEMRSGFMLNDKVLRPAQVKVGKGE